MNRELRINERIRAREVRLIGENGEQLGIYPLLQALQYARDRGLDLVEVAPTAVPPVCRLMEYTKWKFEQSKKEREARKHQKQVLVKEIRFRPKISEHDVDFKVKQILRFLSEGDKVKVNVLFRGREAAHPQIAKQLLDSVLAKVKPYAAVEKPPVFEGRSMSMTLAPTSQAAQAVAPRVPARDPREPAKS
ncbi:MAG: translation initiation factor IF-3 [Dehalococcoidia bacterium]|nr:translation initiation factor IF-3 [Dehalococcoidia bacterium]